MNARVVIEWCRSHEPATVTLTSYRRVRIYGWFVTNWIVFPRCSGGNPANTYNTFQ